MTPRPGHPPFYIVYCAPPPLFSTCIDRIQYYISNDDRERDALAEAQALNRLCVVKVYAPWCKTCRAIEPKYKRVAKANSDEIDFYEVNFSQCKPLCKHLGVESLPCGIIFKDGEKVEHSSLRPTSFKAFVKTLMAFAEPESPLSATLESYQSDMDEMRETERRVSRVAGLSEEPAHER